MLKKKLKSKKAFTLAETMVAVLIMLMVSSILVTGIPAAKDAYERIFVKSNAEVLMSTGIYALRNELSTARDIEVKDNAVTYLNSAYGSRSKIYLGDKGIMYQRYSYMEDGESGSGAEEVKSEPLVSKAASDGRFLKYSSVEEKDGYVTFSGLGVYKSVSDDNSILKKRDLSITEF